MFTLYVISQKTLIKVKKIIMMRLHKMTTKAVKICYTVQVQIWFHLTQISSIYISFVHYNSFLLSANCSARLHKIFTRINQKWRPEKQAYQKRKILTMIKKKLDKNLDNLINRWGDIFDCLLLDQIWRERDFHE